MGVVVVVVVMVIVVVLVTILAHKAIHTGSCTCITGTPVRMLQVWVATVFAQDTME